MGISELNDFSKSESLCHCDASHQVSAQSDLWFGRRCCLKNFKMAAMAKISRWPQWRPSWISERYNFSNFESLSHCDALFGEFQDGGDLGYLNRTILAILNLLCLCDASHQVLTQSDLQFGRRCCLKNFKMATMAAVLDIRTERF